MNIYDLLTGVLSGIFLTLLGFLTKRYVIPGIRYWISESLDLSGQWYCYVQNPSGNTQDMTLDVKQRGNTLGGTIVVIKHLSSKNETEIKRYSASGEVRTKLVILNAHNVQKQAIGAHTELLEIIDGKTLKGLGLWFSATEQIIQSNRFEWKRVDIKGHDQAGHKA